MYHELTHAGHYVIMKGSWYNQFVNSELAEIAANTIHNTYSPYGKGTDGNAPIIALGESWAYYMGHYMADLRYGTLGSCQQEQQGGDSYGPTCDISSTGHSHIDVLEFFDPNLASDPFKWIPKGLYEDLRDDNTETRPILDNVNGFYTNAKMFSAFNSGITTLQGYESNLLNQNGNNQQTQVTYLFTQYHY